MSGGESTRQICPNNGVVGASDGTQQVGLQAARESTGSARVSIAELIDNNEDEEEAAAALGILRNGDEEEAHQRFMQRVQAIPLVNSALGMYDRSRQSSALLRAGTSVIESGVRRMCQPITRRIDVAQLDSFACRQLDNLGYGDEPAPAAASGGNLRKRTKAQAEGDAGGSAARRLGPGEEEEDGDSSGKSRGGGAARWRVGVLVASARDRAVAYRSDSVRRLRYCLEWVAYATAVLRQHIDELRRVLGAMQDAARQAFTQRGAPAADGDLIVAQSADAAERLARARREIVGAVRRAVGVVSHYAGSVLPGEARRQVRALILNLPGRWAAVDPVRASSAASSVASDPALSPAQSPRAAHAQAPEHVDAEVRRTLAFAAEAFHMLDSVRAVFHGLYANAERWMGAPQLADHPENQQLLPPPTPPVPGGPTAWRQPQKPRQMPPPSASSLSSTPVAAVAEIGEQMRRMDVESHSARMDDWDEECIVGEEAAAYKRNRTREPTPT
ncbi:transcriptional regulator opi1 [Coemansia thaxteri]|nr:transcriptional regulator opi1 [Coemansia thaxteri]